MSLTNISDLSHYFVHNNHKLDVLNSISLSLKDEDVIAILGPSGCGKSTLLRCVAGLIEPSTGTITINDLKPNEAIKKKYIGFAFQEPALLNWKRVEENIILPYKIGDRQYKNTLDVHKKLDELLKLVGLEEFRRFFPNQLSAGMKQRVSLARTLFLKPKLLLLDEPFGSLDLLTRTKLMLELSEIVSSVKTPTIIVTHSIEEAVFLAKRIYIISSLPGKVVEIINVDIKTPRKYSLFENEYYLKLVSQCRSILLKFWD